MGLRHYLARIAARRVHVLLAELPGHFETRVAAERLIAERGWVVALSPADADALLVIGAGGSSMNAVLDRVYDGLPGPRARAAVDDGATVSSALDEIHTDLLDESAQQQDAARRGAPVAMAHTEGGGHEGGGHEEGGHGEHQMAPSGIPLAEGAEDRDSLEMDRTHLFLGPVLPLWPAGLIVRCTLHGDTVMDVEVLATPPVSEERSGVRAARRADAAVDVLLLSGADRAAERLRGLRDQCLRPEMDMVRLEEERRRLDGYRLLRWTLGDSHRALLSLLDQAIADLDGTGQVRDEPASLPDLIAGVDLATARLRVAAAGPDLWSRWEVAGR